MTGQPLQAVSSSGERGASEAPKSTVRAVICAIPAPEPVGEYVMLIPSALSTAGIHFEMSGNGNVAPVPTSELAAGRAAAGPCDRDRRDGCSHEDENPSASAFFICPFPIHSVSPLPALTSHVAEQREDLVTHR